MLLYLISAESGRVLYKCTLVIIFMPRKLNELTLLYTFIPLIPLRLNESEIKYCLMTAIISVQSFFFWIQFLNGLMFREMGCWKCQWSWFMCLLPINVCVVFVHICVCTCAYICAQLCALKFKRFYYLFRNFSKCAKWRIMLISTNV